MGLHSRRERREIMREIRSRHAGAGPAAGSGMVRGVRLLDGTATEDLGHAARIPAVAALREGLELDPRVTFLTGENGSGKSTIVEAIAVACGPNAEGEARTASTCSTSPRPRSPRRTC